jgi:hypothetical protein
LVIVEYAHLRTEDGNKFLLDVQSRKSFLGEEQTD